MSRKQLILESARAVGHVEFGIGDACTFQTTASAFMIHRNGVDAKRKKFVRSILSTVNHNCAVANLLRSVVGFV